MRARILFLCIFATAIAAAADLPYVGKWKINNDKSDFGVDHGHVCDVALR